MGFFSFFCQILSEWWAGWSLELLKINCPKPLTSSLYTVITLLFYSPSGIIGFLRWDIFHQNHGFLEFPGGQTRHGASSRTLREDTDWALSLSYILAVTKKQTVRTADLDPVITIVFDKNLPKKVPCLIVHEQFSSHGTEVFYLKFIRGPRSALGCQPLIPRFGNAIRHLLWCQQSSLGSFWETEATAEWIQSVMAWFCALKQSPPPIKP